MEQYNHEKKPRGKKAVVYYGPHPCGKCGQTICKAAIEQGGKEFDYPQGPIYPNTRWKAHICPEK